MHVKELRDQLPEIEDFAQLNYLEPELVPSTSWTYSSGN